MLNLSQMVRKLKKDEAINAGFGKRDLLAWVRDVDAFAEPSKDLLLCYWEPAQVDIWVNPGVDSRHDCT